MLDQNTKNLLRKLAGRYETADFIVGDPSWFMHQVDGRENKETTAFVASCLSYGARKQFLPKIQQLLKFARGNMYVWVKDGAYETDIPATKECFYRLYDYEKMNVFLGMLRELLHAYGSIGNFACEAAKCQTAEDSDVGCVLNALGRWFADRGMKGIVPLPRTSLCKRPVMFMRWMVRDGSPVDLGLWSHFIDRRNLYIPMDTHVFQMSVRLGLLKQKTATWKSVETLREIMLDAFPDDPAKGDFALFGYDAASENS